VAKTKVGRTLSKTEIKVLDVDVNDALLFFFRSRDADVSSFTAKQLTKAYDVLRFSSQVANGHRCAGLSIAALFALT
jgi:hypothetical protein